MLNRSLLYCTIFSFGCLSPLLTVEGDEVVQSFQDLSLQEAVASGNWESVMMQGSQELQLKKSTLATIEFMARMMPSQDLLNIVQGAKSILHLQKKAYISEWDCFALAAFIEKVLPELPVGKVPYNSFTINDIVKKGYFAKGSNTLSTTLPLAVQFVDSYDVYEEASRSSIYAMPKRKAFIHFPVEEDEVFAKTIWYNRDKSNLMVRKEVHSPSEYNAIKHFAKEMESSEYFLIESDGNQIVKPRPNEVQMRRMMRYAALLEIPGVETKKFVVLPNYAKTSLYDELKAKTKFSMKEKVKILKDILEGLSLIHEGKYSNRNIDTRSCHLIFHKGEDDRKISTLIGDLEGVYPWSEFNGNRFQKNSRYLPPEAYSNQNLTKDLEYQFADVFAAGCIAWRLIFDEEVPWGEDAFYEQPKNTLSERYKLYLNLLLPHLSQVRMKIERSTDKPKRNLMKIVVSMLAHNPYDRRTAAYFVDRLNTLYQSL